MLTRRSTTWRYPTQTTYEIEKRGIIVVAVYKKKE
jgi:hypothetical protein